MNQPARVLILTFCAAILAWLCCGVIEAWFLNLGSLGSRLLFQSGPAENALRILALASVTAAAWFHFRSVQRYTETQDRSETARELNRRLLQQTDKALILVTRGGRIELISDAALEYIRHSENLVSGQDFDRFFRPIDNSQSLDFSLESVPANEARREVLALKTDNDPARRFQAEFQRLGGRILVEIDEDPGTEPGAGGIGRLRAGEQKYRHLIETMNDGLVIVRPDLVIEYVNPGLCTIVGFDAEAITGRSLRDFVGADDIDRLNQVLDDARTGPARKIQVRVMLDGGREKVLEVAPTPVVEGGGEYRASFSVVTDVTELVYGGELVRRSEERLNMALKGAADGLWDYNVATGEILRSSYVPSNLGYADQEIEQTVGGWEAILHPDDRERVMSAFNDLLEGRADTYEAEQRLRARDGSWHWVLDRGWVVERDAAGRPARIIGIHKDIDSRKQSDEVLHRAEEHLRAIFESAEDSIFIKDRNRVYTHISPGMAKLFGCTADELVGRTDRELLGEEPEDHVREDQRVLAGETVREERVKTIGGREYLLHVVKVPLRDNEGNVTGICGIARDITSRYGIERRLLASEEKFRLLAENTLDVIVRYDRELRHIYVNPAYLQLTGLTEEEVIGRTHRERELPEDLCAFFEGVLPRVFTGGQPESAQLSFEVLGRQVAFEVNFVPERDTEGRVVSVLSTGHEITKIKKVEAALRQSEEQYRTLVDLMPDGIATTDPDLNLAYANRSFCRMLGYECGEILGKPAADFLDNNNFWALKAQSEKRRSGELGAYELTWRHRLGHDVVTRVSPAPVHKINGSYHSSAIITDITAYKTAEQALHDSQEYTRAVIDGSPIGITVRDPQGRLLDYNPAWQRLWGITEEQIKTDMSDMEKDIYGDRWRGSYIDEYLSQVWKVFEEGGALYLPDLRTESSEPGKAWWVSHNFYAIRDENGKVDRVVTMTEDVTARKLAEEALRDSEEFSRAVIDNSPLGISVRTAKGKLLSYNQSWQKLWKIPEDVINDDLSTEREDLTFSERDDYLKPYHDQVRRVYEQGGNLFVPEVETKPLRPGAARWVSSYFYAIQDSQGDVDRVVILTEDISARKAAEEALRNSEEFSRAVIDNSPIGISVRTAAGRLLSYNQAWQKLWNIPDEEVQADMSRERDGLSFNDRDDYLESFKDEIRRVYTHGGNLFIPEIKTLGRRPGAAKWVSSYFYAIRDGEGRVDRVVILTEDITARKQAEEEREQLITELRNALSDIKTLRGLLPICAHCKKIRDDQGYWNKIERYLSAHSQVSFSHGICPDCAEKYYPEVKLYSDEEKAKVDHEEEPNPDELEIFE